MSPGRIKATVLACHFAGAFGPMGLSGLRPAPTRA